MELSRALARLHQGSSFLVKSPALAYGSRCARWAHQHATPVTSPKMVVSCSSGFRRRSEMQDDMFVRTREVECPYVAQRFIALSPSASASAGFGSLIEKFERLAVSRPEGVILLRFPQREVLEPELEEATAVPPLEASSTLKKRRLKMNKHKYRKRRKRDRRRTKR